MAFLGPGSGGGYPPHSLNPGTGGNRDPIKPYHDEISYQAQHTADLEREDAESKRRLPSRLVRRVLGIFRSLF